MMRVQQPVFGHLPMSASEEKNAGNLSGEDNRYHEPQELLFVSGLTLCTALPWTMKTVRTQQRLWGNFAVRLRNILATKHQCCQEMGGLNCTARSASLTSHSRRPICYHCFWTGIVPAWQCQAIKGALCTVFGPKGAFPPNHQSAKVWAKNGGT